MSLTKVIQTNLLLELIPTLYNIWRPCQSSFFHTSHSWQKTQAVEVSRSFHHLVRTVSLKLRSRSIFKKIWLIWWQTASFRPFRRKNPLWNSSVKSRTILSLDKVQLWLCYHLDQHACVKKFFCHGINEDQTEKLPAAGIRLDTHCQYCAT